MQAYLKFSRILTAVLLPLSHIDTAPVVEPYAPPTGDVNFGIIAAIVCKNDALAERLKAAKGGGQTELIPLAFCENILEYIAASDLYFGKSGSGIAEPSFFGVPSAVWHFSEYYSIPFSCMQISPVVWMWSLVLPLCLGLSWMRTSNVRSSPFPSRISGIAGISHLVPG